MVVGGGSVGARKALALDDAGARVTVISPELAPDITEGHPTIAIEKRQYAGPPDIADADLVIAATDSHELNCRIADDARSLHRLVNVVTDGSAGTFTSMAMHRAGALTIGVTARNLPAAAARIRDAIGERFTERYARAIERLSAERRDQITAGTAEWSMLNSDIFGPDFCKRVERGDFDEAAR